MVDVDSVLLSVQERDKWRRRMELLERSLTDVRGRRLRLEARLRRVRKELQKLHRASDAVMDMRRMDAQSEVRRGTTGFAYAGR